MTMAITVYNNGATEFYRADPEGSRRSDVRYYFVHHCRITPPFLRRQRLTAPYSRLSRRKACRRRTHSVVAAHMRTANLAPSYRNGIASESGNPAFRQATTFADCRAGEAGYRPSYGLWCRRSTSCRVFAGANNDVGQVLKRH